MDATDLRVIKLDRRRGGASKFSDGGALIRDIISALTLSI